MDIFRLTDNHTSNESQTKEQWQHITAPHLKIPETKYQQAYDNKRVALKQHQTRKKAKPQFCSKLITSS
jgi:hypothetical protein